jgi:hypothetical protein
MSQHHPDEERRLRRAAVTRFGVTPEETADASPEEDDKQASARMEQKALWVDLQVRRAIDRGDFDDLPGAGKPLRLPDRHDPDWWVKSLIERERITGIAPPAIGLRQEDAELDAQLDREPNAEAVRRTVADFNRRVVEARRQLTGGPPVVTRTRDPEVEVERWRERRESARAAAQEAVRRDRRQRERDAAEARAARRRRWRLPLRRRDEAG